MGESYDTSFLQFLQIALLQNIRPLVFLTSFIKSPIRPEGPAYWMWESFNINWFTDQNEWNTIPCEVS